MTGNKKKRKERDYPTKTMAKKYTTLLLDVDNTLLNFDIDEKNALKKTLKEVGAPTEDAVLRLYSEINAGLWRQFEKGEVTKEELKNIRFQKLFEAIGLPCPVSSREINDRYLENLGEGGITVDGAKETVQALFERGYTLYIVTNGVEHTQKSRLQRSGLDRYITDSFVSEKIGIQKPFKAYFDYVFDNIEEKDKSKLLLIGDSLGSDIKGALDSGIDCVWYNPKKKENTVCGEPTYEISDIRDLMKML
ncbi:MAG: YjjG family noncanonical pyrimidine nucleotidase [Oscillospiraceae bacterium]|nr:YjjG family noncanonical pyrimidine nucleotidase [Oscillospiraceae bacterium]